MSAALCIAASPTLGSNSIYLEERSFRCHSEKRCQYRKPCEINTSEKLDFTSNTAMFVWGDRERKPYHLRKGILEGHVSYLEGPDGPSEMDITYRTRIRGLNTDQILARAVGQERKSGWFAMVWPDRAEVFHTRTRKTGSKNPFKKKLYEVVVFRCEAMS